MPASQPPWALLSDQKGAAAARVDGEARAAEHSVHWLRPPNGIDHEAIAMMMDLADRITATMPISEALREG